MHKPCVEKFSLLRHEQDSLNAHCKEHPSSVAFVFRVFLAVGTAWLGQRVHGLWTRHAEAIPRGRLVHGQQRVRCF